MITLTPREIVSELDRFIVGQDQAKKSLAMALRNRWRRKNVSPDIRDEILPKNILMIGPTGVGKTELARRLAKLADSPFIKVEATKFTEVGYVGRDVESIIRDLVEISLMQNKKREKREILEKAGPKAEEKILDALVNLPTSEDNREHMRTLLRKGELDDQDIEIEVPDQANIFSAMDIPGMPGGQMGMLNIGEMLGKGAGQRMKKRTLKVQAAMKILLDLESEKLVDQDKLVQDSIRMVEEEGIVFIDEIDKICGHERHQANVSREGVQRDLLPLIEGTTVTTKHGAVNTDHILFITSGAFHVARPSDLLPELQGRLPIRVELNALLEKDMVRILTEPECNLIRQYTALMATEEVTLDFKKDAITELAKIATKVNAEVENIGARRLHTLLEKLLEEISFAAKDNAGKTLVINKKRVGDNLKNLVEVQDLSKFIL